MYNKIINNNYLYIFSCSLFFILATSCAENQNEENPTTRQAPETMLQAITLIEQDDERRVDVWIDGKFFTSYLYPESLQKPVLYPINSAQGTPVTRGYPLDPRTGESEDHPHQVGLWLNYGDVNGLDFWNHSDRIPEERKAFYGTIVHREITGINSGDEAGKLEVVKEWVDSEGELLLLENTTFIFRGTEHERMIDRITRLTAPDRDVSLKDNKEGVLGLRMTRELEHPDEHGDATGIYRSSEGLESHDVWGTRGRWMNLSGRIGDEPVSVAILDHPTNVGYPTYWHARGYGLFAANPLGMKEMSGGEEELNFSLSAGESLTFHHRIIIWSGEEISDEQVEEAWTEWAE